MNIPNILTTIRFFLIPAFIIVFYSSIENSLLYATYIFVLAGITDVLDGYIARKYDMVTKYGTVLDPLADKLMQIAALICFTSEGYIPIWVIIVIGLKEITMILGGLLLYFKENKTVIPANKFGKMATISFYVAILAVAFDFNYIINYILITITVIIMLIAFIKYLIGFKRVKMVNNNKECVDK
ncbi:CDP-diacylglycerol--glycerol-3-phosphate 3-phosphatidyltransferase [Dethiothermospora halolimnae]|uniref:CDP-diacylglycerol--glycerol-3-phosphate 3-phosphatidyltransferase n=1 Tax=Dethiothermospora halolimnae TaxID=3114390 RepID=UPI003CCB770D